MMTSLNVTSHMDLYPPHTLNINILLSISPILVRMFYIADTSNYYVVCLETMSFVSQMKSEISLNITHLGSTTMQTGNDIQVEKNRHY